MCHISWYYYVFCDRLYIALSLSFFLIYIYITCITFFFSNIFIGYNLYYFSSLECYLIVFVFSGYYMYIEASRGSTTIDTARLDSSILPAGKDFCLTFWYHMFGPDVHTLRVRQLFNRYSKRLWMRRGQQGETSYYLTTSHASVTPFYLNTLGM